MGKIGIKHVKQFIIFLLLLFTCCIVVDFNVVFANEKNERNISQNVQETLKIFNIPISDVNIEKFPLSDELYIVSSPYNTFYLSPKGYLIFGDILIKKNNKVVSYNMEYETLQISQKLNNIVIDLNKSVTVGNGEKKVISFINLNCPFSKQGYEYLINNKNVTQHIYITIQNEHDEEMLSYIICSSDKNNALTQIFNKNIDKKIKTDEKCQTDINIKDIIDYHKNIVKKLSINRAPVYVVDKQVIIGINFEEISNILNK